MVAEFAYDNDTDQYVFLTKLLNCLRGHKRDGCLLLLYPSGTYWTWAMEW